MFVRKKKNRSGTTSVIVAEKQGGRFRELITIGVSSDESEVAELVRKGKEWIDREQERRHPRLDLFGDERRACEDELAVTEGVLSNISNILINGSDIILDRVFDKVGFNRIEDTVFRQLVKARLSYPASKAATVEYLKNHFDEDVDLSRIYRYLDKLGDIQHRLVQEINVRHMLELFGGNIGLLFYDVTTLYFEADREEDLRRTGFSKEGRHRNPQVILGLLVSLEGYPLAYCIHEGNKYEGHTMLPVVQQFVREYDLHDFIVVADSGLMTNTDIPTDAVYAAYHNLWNVERAFRIAKSKIEVRPMFHFTRRRIDAHVCICFVALKVYKELERLLKLSNINMSVDKVLAMAKTVTTVEIRLPLNKKVIRKTMIMERHKRIAPLFEDDFWVTH